MPATRIRGADAAPGASAPTTARPVLLATLSSRVDPGAERVAIDSALEAGVRLIVANLLPLRPYPTTLGLVGPSGVNLPHEEDLEAVRATAARAAQLGIRTELLRVTTRRPVAAVLELVRERDAGLLVFGPALDRVGRLRFKVTARRLREAADCLVWIAPDG
jgi:nucleotide-binding universal stress UspA family protein